MVITCISVYGTSINAPPLLVKFRPMVDNGSSSTSRAGVVDLNGKGKRQTRQKALILETIRQAAGPLTADQILTCARQSRVDLALTTVYRNLEQLSNQRTITRLIYPDGVTRYRLAESGHHHELTCLGCSRKIDIDQCPLECLTRQIESETGFAIVSHQLELYGYCEDCRPKDAAT
jgi:Fur family transcriptional regulator, ferric uptake regulator